MIGDLKVIAVAALLCATAAACSTNTVLQSQPSADHYAADGQNSHAAQPQISDDGSDAGITNGNFTECDYEIGEIVPVNLPKRLISEKEYHSPDEKTVIRLITEYDPEDHWTLEPIEVGGYPIVKLFLGEELILEEITRKGLANGESVVWIDNENAVIFGRYIFNAKTLDVEKIDLPFLNDDETNACHYAVSPDKKYILYRCSDWFDGADTTFDSTKSLLVLYDIAEKSFRILKEKDISALEERIGPVKIEFMWKDENTFILSMIPYYDELTVLPTEEININDEKISESEFSDGTVRAMSNDGKHWITERFSGQTPTTDMTKILLCDDKGFEYELYEAERSIDSYHFIDNRYLDVRNPTDATVIDNIFYDYTLRLYDLKQRVYYKIKFMEPIFEKYGEDTKLELLNYRIDGETVTFTFAEFPLYGNYDENTERNSVRFEVELLPDNVLSSEIQQASMVVPS